MTNGLKIIWKGSVQIRTVEYRFHDKKVHHVRRAMTIMTENRPFPRENKDNFMRGGGVHLEYCALGLS